MLSLITQTEMSTVFVPLLVSLLFAFATSCTGVVSLLLESEDAILTSGLVALH